MSKEAAKSIASNFCLALIFLAVFLVLSWLSFKFFAIILGLFGAVRVWPVLTLILLAFFIFLFFRKRRKWSGFLNEKFFSRFLDILFVIILGGSFSIYFYSLVQNHPALAASKIFTPEITNNSDLGIDWGDCPWLEQPPTLLVPGTFIQHRYKAYGNLSGGRIDIKFPVEVRASAEKNQVQPGESISVNVAVRGVDAEGKEINIDLGAKGGIIQESRFGYFGNWTSWYQIMDLNIDLMMDWEKDGVIPLGPDEFTMSDSIGLLPLWERQDETREFKFRVNSTTTQQAQLCLSSLEYQSRTQLWFGPQLVILPGTLDLDLSLPPINITDFIGQFDQYSWFPINKMLGLADCLESVVIGQQGAEGSSSENNSPSGSEASGEKEQNQNEKLKQGACQGKSPKASAVCSVCERGDSSENTAYFDAFRKQSLWLSGKPSQAYEGKTIKNYVWYLGKSGGSGWEQVSSGSSPDYTIFADSSWISQAGPMKLLAKLLVTDSKNCEDDYFMYINVRCADNDKAAVDAGSDVRAEAGDAFVLSGKITSSPVGRQIKKVLWSSKNPDALPLYGETGVFLSFNAPAGKFTKTTNGPVEVVMEVADSIGCVSYDSVYVTIEEKSSPEPGDSQTSRPQAEVHGYLTTGDKTIQTVYVSQGDNVRYLYTVKNAGMANLTVTKLFVNYLFDDNGFRDVGDYLTKNLSVVVQPGEEANISDEYHNASGVGRWKGEAVFTITSSGITKDFDTSTNILQIQ